MRLLLPLAATLSLGLCLDAAMAQGTPASPPSTAAPAPSTSQPSVEPEARQALQQMSAYLGTLDAFEIDTVTSLDLVTHTGQRIQLDGTANYKVRRPNGFVISVSTDWKKRSFWYDGKQFTQDAPELGYYSTVAAPPTILETLDAIYERYGIALPIEDLFRWNDVKSRRTEALDSGFLVGDVTVDGVPTKQYAFRQGQVDWQVWIEQGARPLPRKLVIVDRSDPAQPAYVARLKWNTSATFASDAFVFRPRGTQKQIRFATLEKSQ